MKDFEAFRNNNLDELIVRFELQARSNNISYFDVEEFESLVEYYLEVQRPRTAAIALKAALHQHPNSSYLSILKARLMFVRHHFGKALRILKEIDNTGRKEYNYWFLKGELYLRLGKIDRSKKCFMMALRNRPDNSEYFFLDIAYEFIASNYLEIAIFFLQAGVRNNSESVELLFELGTCYADAGQSEKSIATLNHAIDKDPFNEDAWFFLGLIYIDKLNNLEMALDSFEYALAINDKNELAYFYKGKTLFEAGRFDLAVEAYRAYGEIGEMPGQAALLIAECFFESRDYEPAIINYEIATVYPDCFIEATLGLGYSYLEKEDFNRALFYFKSVLLKESNNDEAWFGAGDCLMGLSIYPEALKSYEKSLEFDSTAPEIWLAIAGVHIETKAYLLGEQILDQGLSVIGYENNLALRMAVCKFHLGKLEEALDMLRLFVEQGGEDFEIFNYYCPRARDLKAFKNIIPNSAFDELWKGHLETE